MRPKVRFQCQQCGAVTPKWAGRCVECGGWNSLTEQPVKQGQGSRVRLVRGAGAPAGIVPLSEVDLVDEPRVTTRITELDRVLGGGLIAGSVVLIGGDPGIGKSTLLLQTLAAVSRGRELTTLYVSGEESARQVGLRAQRLGLDAANFRFLTETNIERLLELATAEAPRVMVIDSIQTVYTDALSSAPGALGQVRESTMQLVRFAKESGTVLFIVGHVTKDGALAGPRVLEHMVDTVLYFEGDRSSRFRLIRAVKNRYGAVNELGVFAMTDKGLKEVSNPSAIFLTRHEAEIPGSVVMVTRQGTRPLLVEVQALVDDSHLANPRRVSVGLEQNRLAMLLAVLHRHNGTATYNQDVFINIVGGVRINETGADLPVLLAVLSSLKGKPLPRGLVAFGEVGLSGEIRPVQNGSERLNEAAKHGFKRAVIAKANSPKVDLLNMDITTVSTVKEALETVWQ